MEPHAMTMPIVKRADGALGPVPGMCYAIVVKVHNSDPASGYPSDVNMPAAFTYDIDAQTPFGPVHGIQKCSVGVPRWPMMVRAFAVGQPVLALSLNGKVSIMTAEMPFVEKCGWRPRATTPTTPPPALDTAPGDQFPIPSPRQRNPYPGTYPSIPDPIFPPSGGTT